MGRAKRIWYLSPMRAAKVQASLRIRAVSPEPSLLAHTSSESRGTFRQKARSLAPLNGWACAVKICHDGMLEDTNSLDAAQMLLYNKGFARKRICNDSLVQIENSVTQSPQDSCLKSLVKQNSYPRGGVFDMHLTVISKYFINLTTYNE